MDTPHDLPPAGYWVVTSDGSLFEIADSDTDGCTLITCDVMDDDEGDRNWQPWSDIVWVGPDSDSAPGFEPLPTDGLAYAYPSPAPFSIRRA